MRKLLSLKFQERIFNRTVYITYALILLSYLGLSQYAPKFLYDINYYFNFYICLFLLWRFNPFRRLDKFTNLDRKIAFSAGLFILTTTLLNDFLDKFNKFKNKISDIY